MRSIVTAGLLLFSLGYAWAAPDYRWDISVYDRLLANLKPDQKIVPFGDVGITPTQLRTLREQLVRLQNAANKGIAPEPETTTPPAATFVPWTSGNVYYQFDSTQVGNGTITALKMQQFRDAVAEWAAFANLHFIEFTGTPPTHYITVQQNSTGTEGGYSSSVGMAPSGQLLQFGNGSWNRGTICHEMGHALGLEHEHQRPDRETYVHVHTENLADPNDPNFVIVMGAQTLGTAYDFYSVMHYSRNFASNNGGDTITMQSGSTQYLDVIGTVYDRPLSKIDRAGMATIYGNPSTLPSAVVTNTNDSGIGSLRSAIYYAFDRSTDAVPTPVTIAFQIPLSDPNYDTSGGVFHIKPTFELVAPGNGTTIDGTSQTAGSNTNGPKIVLDGSNFTALSVAPFFYSGRGVFLRAANCTVKGLTITNFNGAGVQIFQGTDPNGSNSTGNTIDSNRISACGTYGIEIKDATTTGNIVKGNYVGTDQTGTSAQPDLNVGVVLHNGAHGNIVGPGNVLSGNTFQGLTIFDSGTTGNLVQGNYIGTDKNGTAALPNQTSGISIYNGAQTNTIGGLVPGTRNVISGNASQAITIDGVTTSGNLLQGNFIGLDATGLTSLANNFITVEIFGGATGNIVGGTAAGARNFICGSGSYGLTIIGAGTSGNFVQGNSIGVNTAGAARGNAFQGVAIFGGATGNLVGGSAAGASNVISGNLSDGLAQYESATMQNTFSRNSINGNSFRGIALYNGSNNGQPYPVISSAVLGPAENVSGTDVAGTFGGSGANTLEFFASPTADSSGFGEGQNYLGSLSVAGSGSFTAHLVAAVPAGNVVSATATDSLGNTSEFSSAFTVTSTDNGSDGMTDAWMTLYFGHIDPRSNDKSRASDDADGDGLTNLQEFLAGIAPNDATKRFRITAVGHASSDVTVTFASVVGKTYRIESKDDLTASTWSLVQDQIAATGTSTSITDPGALGLPKRFYHVALEP